ncbi:hypothetical protein ACC745_39335, partial [Rhizobium ruizarguesonis]
IVSMTITEGGYFIDSSGTFNPTHPAIAADGQNPNAPKTLFGLIVAGLKARKDKGIGPFTVMPAALAAATPAGLSSTT